MHVARARTASPFRRESSKRQRLSDDTRSKSWLGPEVGPRPTSGYPSPPMSGSGSPPRTPPQSSQEIASILSTAIFNPVPGRGYPGTGTTAPGFGPSVQPYLRPLGRPFEEEQTRHQFVPQTQAPAVTTGQPLTQQYGHPAVTGSFSLPPAEHPGYLLQPTSQAPQLTRPTSLRTTRPTRRTKAHVASACINCKRAHLSCDVQRPCARCVASGKEVRLSMKP